MMEEEIARKVAEDMMVQHGLGDWRFDFVTAYQQMGCCWHDKQLITLSRQMVELNDERAIRSLMLHEIAHALCGEDEGHGIRWQQMCRKIGGSPSRTVEGYVKVPGKRWLGVCPVCKEVRQVRQELGKQFLAGRPSCGSCSPRVWDERFVLRWIDRRELS